MNGPELRPRAPAREGMRPEPPREQSAATGVPIPVVPRSLTHVSSPRGHEHGSGHVVCSRRWQAQLRLGRFGWGRGRFEVIVTLDQSGSWSMTETRWPKSSKTLQRLRDQGSGGIETSRDMVGILGHTISCFGPRFPHPRNSVKKRSELVSIGIETLFKAAW